MSSVPVGPTRNSNGGAPAGGHRRSRLSQGATTQRARLVTAMGELVAEVGVPAIGVHHVCQRARISRRTFYDLYEDRGGCLAETLAEAHARLLAHVGDAVSAAGPVWADRVVAATQALLGAWEADRVLAQLCLLSSDGGDGLAIEGRRESFSQIVALLADVPQPAPGGDAVVIGALGGVWELAARKLPAADAPEGAFADLGSEAIFLMLAPFVGRRQAAARVAGREIGDAYVTRWTPTVSGEEPPLLVTELTRHTLEYLAAHPGAANVDIARAVDVRHESQMSRHLSRLARAGMVTRRKEGRANAWHLTEAGREAAAAVCAAASRAVRAP